MLLNAAPHLHDGVFIHDSSNRVADIGECVCRQCHDSRCGHLACPQSLMANGRLPIFQTLDNHFPPCNSCWTSRCVCVSECAWCSNTLLQTVGSLTMLNISLKHATRLTQLVAQGRQRRHFIYARLALPDANFNAIMRQHIIVHTICFSTIITATAISSIHCVQFGCCVQRAESFD